jgi:hypothetical protein
VPGSLGGCDAPDCVVPHCRACHRAYYGGELDRLPHLKPRYRVELAHGRRQLGLLACSGPQDDERKRCVDVH